MTTPSQTDDREAGAVARIVARHDGPTDWSAVHELAAADDGVWRRLALALHDDARVRLALAPMLAEADAVALPAARVRPARASTWLAAAAAVALIVLAFRVPLGGPAPAPASAPAPADEVVVHELPRVVLEARPARDGRGTEVVYLRRTLERAVVNQVVELAADEYGEPRAQLVNAAVLQGAGRF